jgi:hypothetical protein
MECMFANPSFEKDGRNVQNGHSRDGIFDDGDGNPRVC